MLKFAIILTLALIFVPIVLELGIEVAAIVVALGILAWALWFIASIYGLILLGFVGVAALVLWGRDKYRARRIIVPPVHQVPSPESAGTDPVDSSPVEPL